MNGTRAGPTRDLLLLGGGHAQVEVLRRFARRPEPGWRLTLIARERAAPYSGMLPAAIRGEIATAAAAVDLDPLATRAGARLVVATATAIDPAARLVRLTDGDTLPYDLLSIDVGGVPTMPRTADATAIPVKPIDRLRERLAALETGLAAGARLAVVGDGAAGVELALALARHFAGRVRLVLVGAGAAPLAEAPPRARRVARAALEAAGIALRAGARVIGMEGARLILSDGGTEPVAAALFATGVVGPALLAESGLACDPSGCVRVAATLRSVSHPEVFAAGDCAAIAGAGRPKAGVWAVRAGPVLAENLRRAARGQPPRPWRPQRRALAILGLGDGRAVAWRGRFSLTGRAVAAWKSWLDRRWMRRYG